MMRRRCELPLRALLCTMLNGMAASYWTPVSLIHCAVTGEHELASSVGPRR